MVPESVDVSIQQTKYWVYSGVSMKKDSTVKDTPMHYEQELKFVQERLTRCLQLLKINHDDNQISTTAFKLIEKAIPEQIAKKIHVGE
jgi:hypothetical protein